MSESLRHLRRKPRARLDAIHERREQLEGLGLRMERNEELHHDPDGGVRVIYTVSERLPPRDS